MDRDLTIVDKKQRILNIFKHYTQGPSVPSDGNCGLHAICKALGDGLYMTDINTNTNSLMLNIFYMFDLKKLPNYWWSDEELAVIANDFGYDMYIYNEKDRTGIVFGKGIRPPLVLYSVNNNSHWIPGMRTVVPSSSIPENFTIVENISEVLSIREIKNKIKRHLLIRSLNPIGACIESYNGRRDGSRNSSNGRRAITSSRRHSRSRSGGHDEGRDRSHRGRNTVSRNKRRGKSLSKEFDAVRFVRLDGSRPQFEIDYGKEVKGNHNAGENECHSGEEKGSNSGGEKRSHRGRAKNIRRKSDEQLLVPYSPTVNGDCSYGINAFKQELSLFTKLKNTVLIKMVRQLYHWNWNEKIKYKKLNLLDTEDEGDDSENIELNAMSNIRYTVARDMLHNFVSKNEHKPLMLEACDGMVAPQPLDPTIFQLEPMNCSEIEPVECRIMEGCCQITTVEYCPKVTIGGSSSGANDCCSNVAVDDKASIGSLTSTNCPCNVDGCPFAEPEYPSSDQWVSDKYIKDLYNVYNTLEQNKIKSTRLLDSTYNQAVAMNNVIVRCIAKPKRAVEASPAVASVLMAPAVLSSVVAASVVASPAIADWMVTASGLSFSVTQVAPAVAAPAMMALMMVVPKVAAPTMAMAVEAAPSGNDLVTVSVDHDLLATPMENNLTMTSTDNDSVVKPNACVKRYFSLKQIWKNKTKIQHSKNH